MTEDQKERQFTELARELFPRELWSAGEIRLLDQLGLSGWFGLLPDDDDD